MLRLKILLFLLLCSCTASLNPRSIFTNNETDFSLTIYVSAAHLDYRSAKACLHSLSKKNSRFGHVWIRLKGIKNGQPWIIEGGHSGELGERQPRYWEGVAALIEAGDPDPIRYLFATQNDGFFQKGSGGHAATFAARRALTSIQFEQMVTYIKNYPFSSYALTGQQCTTFAIELAAIAGWELKGDVTLAIPPLIKFQGEKIKLWRDPSYATITIGSPDCLEKSLRISVARHEAIGGL